MADINLEAVAGKLNRVGYEALFKALRQAKGAGNRNVELAHWLIHARLIQVHLHVILSRRQTARPTYAEGMPAIRGLSNVMILSHSEGRSFVQEMGK